MPGSQMRREMAEQPEVLARLLSRRTSVDAGRAGVVIVARGSSDHAAVYGRYLLELATGRPVALAAPSLYTRYGAQTDASRLARGCGVASRARRPRSSTSSSACARPADARSRSPTTRTRRSRPREVVHRAGGGRGAGRPGDQDLHGPDGRVRGARGGAGDVPWAEGDLARVPDVGRRRARRPGRAGQALAERWARDRGARRHRARLALLRRAGDRAEGRARRRS